MLKALPTRENGFLLTSWDKGEDAATWMLDGKEDGHHDPRFHNPHVVDDPFTYGQIAAANALSDVYAMGGQAAGGPEHRRFPRHLRTAGGAVGDPQGRSGGSARPGPSSPAATVSTTESPSTALRLRGRSREDVEGHRGPPRRRFILTKPLGTGLARNGHKSRGGRPWETEAAVRSMGALNDLPARLPGELLAEVHACTDVTGFSLAGHLLDMLSDGGWRRGSPPVNCPCCPGRSRRPRWALSPAARSKHGTIRPEGRGPGKRCRTLPPCFSTWGHRAGSCWP